MEKGCRRGGGGVGGGKHEMDKGMQDSICRGCSAQWRLSEHKGRGLAEMEQQSQTNPLKKNGFSNVCVT